MSDRSVADSLRESEHLLAERAGHITPARYHRFHLANTASASTAESAVWSPLIDRLDDWTDNGRPNRLRGRWRYVDSVDI